MSYTKTDEAGIYRHETIDGKWRVDTTLTVDGERKRKRRTLSDASLEEAKEVRQKLKAEMLNETKEEREDNSIPTGSIAEFVIDWLDEMNERGRWNENTFEHNLQNFRDHILPIIGGIDADDLRRDDLRRWIDYAETIRKDNGERYSKASVQRWWRNVRHMVKALYLEGYCDRRIVDWCREVRGPKGAEAKRRESRTLTMDELSEYVETAEKMEPRWYPAICTLAYTGMRAGELFGLEWQDVDYDRKVIHVRRSYSRGNLGPTKTGEARTVPIVPTVADALQHQRERLVREQNIGLAEDIVFPSNNGKRRTSSVLHSPMKAVAEACGIDIKVGPQVLRKTLNTLLDNVGVTGKMIKSITGHRTDEMSEHYDEKRAEDQLAAVETLFKAAGGN